MTRRREWQSVLINSVRIKYEIDFLNFMSSLYLRGT